MRTYSYGTLMVYACVFILINNIQNLQITACIIALVKHKIATANTNVCFLVFYLNKMREDLQVKPLIVSQLPTPTQKNDFEELNPKNVYLSDLNGTNQIVSFKIDWNQWGTLSLVYHHEIALHICGGGFYYQIIQLCSQQQDPIKILNR